jgi:hypothetical protein
VPTLAAHGGPGAARILASARVRIRGRAAQGVDVPPALPRALLWGVLGARLAGSPPHPRRAAGATTASLEDTVQLRSASVRGASAANTPASPRGPSGSQGRGGRLRRHSTRGGVRPPGGAARKVGEETSWTRRLQTAERALRRWPADADAAAAATPTQAGTSTRGKPCSGRGMSGHSPPPTHGTRPRRQRGGSVARARRLARCRRDCNTGGRAAPSHRMRPQSRISGLQAQLTTAVRGRGAGDGSYNSSSCLARERFRDYASPRKRKGGPRTGPRGRTSRCERGRWRPNGKGATGWDGEEAARGGGRHPSAGERGARNASRPVNSGSSGYASMNAAAWAAVRAQIAADAVKRAERGTRVVPPPEPTEARRKRTGKEIAESLRIPRPVPAHM